MCRIILSTKAPYGFIAPVYGGEALPGLLLPRRILGKAIFGVWQCWDMCLVVFIVYGGVMFNGGQWICRGVLRLHKFRMQVVLYYLLLHS